MRHQLGGGEESKNPPILSETGLEKEPAPDLLVEDDIDPADFFDPEEFGFRRRGSNVSRP